MPSDPLLILLVAGGLAAALLLRIHVLFFLVVALFFIGPGLIPSLIEISEFTVRAVDVVFIILLARLAINALIGTHRVAVPRLVFPLAAFATYVGLSLIWVVLSIPTQAGASTASYARFLQTLLLVPVTYLVLPSGVDVWRFLRFYVAVAVLTIGVTAVRTLLLPEVSLGTIRGEGILGTNSVGLVSGVLVVLAVVARDLPFRRGSALAGLIGLMLTKSVAATVATLIVLSLYYVTRRRVPGPVLPLKVLAAGIVAVALSLSIGWSLRRTDLEGLLRFSGGSFVERVYLMSVGLGLFVQRPLLGHGWQASTNPTLVEPGRPSLFAFREELVDHFSTTLLERTSVHNMYVQLLAELGVIGFGLFLLVVARVWRHARRTLRHYPPGHPWHGAARFLSLSLLQMLIWWNSSALFPGQVETVLAMVFVGSLTALRVPITAAAPSTAAARR